MKPKSSLSNNIKESVGNAANFLLIVSQSSRMLAQSAKLAGLRPMTIDLFADIDTEALAEERERVDSSHSGFCGEALLSTVVSFSKRYPDIPLIYGSGLDGNPELLAALSAHCLIFGNPPEVLRRVKSPREFFAALEVLSIPFPETRFVPPKGSGQWLVKDRASEGGYGVQIYQPKQRYHLDSYYQRQIQGVSMSALFLADGLTTRVIGFNTQWTEPGGDQQPYRFCGVINRAALDQRQRLALARYSQVLTKSFGLRGLNSIDFILSHEGCKIIEINPRPPASFGLYDGYFPRGLVAEHIDACRGLLSRAEWPRFAVNAQRILFAGEDLSVPNSLDWPAWCVDRPRPGRVILRGEPLCSVTADGTERDEVERQIESRGQQALEHFKPAGKRRDEHISLSKTTK